ncbi:MAG: acyltransferase [Candidatus Aenigmarchaeota archaeon]
MEKKNGSKRMITCFKFPEEGKSYRKWKKVRHPIRVFRNYIIITLGKILPDIEFKNRLYRRIGIRIGKNVHIYGTNLDIFFPELLEIGNNCTLGAYSTILTHEFFNGEYRMGKVRVGNNVLLGTMCLVLPGVEIGDNATVAAYSLVNKDVPPGAFVGGVPAKEIKR